MKHMILILAALAAACGSSPAGPSPVTAAAPVVAQVVAKPFPASLDPAYVRALVVVDPAGTPRHWAGGAFHHCYGPDIDAVVVDETALRMTALTGIPRTESGPCNVTWEIDSRAGALGAYSELRGSDSAILSAKMGFFSPYFLRNAEHESGHVLGLLHSPRERDCMYGGAQVTRPDFSPDELAVLAWMYR